MTFQSELTFGPWQAGMFTPGGGGQPYRTILLGGAAWSPAELFTAGEQGVWYDPSDFSTMFQDAAGTTPVTAFGQPVGFVGDKRLGFTPGPNIAPGGGTFDSSTGYTLPANTTISGGKLNFSGATSGTAVGVDTNGIAGRRYRVTYTIESITGELRLRMGSGGDVAIGNTAAGTYSYILQSGGNGDLEIQVRSTTTAVVDTLRVEELPGNHATQPTAASRPILRQTAGGLAYLELDGVDDFLVTGNIDFSASDEMTVIAGVRKLSDAAAGEVVGLSTSPGGSSGTFFIRAPAVPGANYEYRSRGTTANGSRFTNASVAAPVTNVVTGLSDISAPSEILRVNGIERASSTATQGTGNYGSTFPLFIGRVGGTSFPFNGHLFSLIVRGRTTAGADLTAAEAFVAAQTGVTL